MRTQSVQPQIAKCGTLSMGEIDQISQMLGRLESKTDAQTLDLAHIRNVVVVVKNDTEKLTNALVLQDSHTKALHSRMDIVEATVNSHEALKNKGMGNFAFISLIFGIIGWGISTFIGKIFP